MTDWQLLQQYVQTRSPDAFAELVRRHSGWIRAAARRQARDEHLADDVAQAVLLALSQQAHRLHEGAALSTWLFQVTRYASAAALRAQSRRKRHEHAAATVMSSVESDSMTPAQWEQLAPMLDGLVGRLRYDDQRAVLLRFYEQKSYPDMAGVLGISEEAARKRTDRAVEKLRQLIGSRELVLSSGALSAGLLAHAADAAPVTQIPSPAAHVVAITKGALQMMTLVKLKIPAAAALFVLVLTAGAITFSLADPPAASPAGSASVAAAAAATPATTAATTQAVDESTPKGVIRAAFRAAAAGDANGLISRFERVSPQQEATMRQVAGLMSAANDLTTVVEEKFGADMEQQLARAIGTGVLDVDIAFAAEAIDGDSAIVDIGAGPGRIPLIKSGQTWKISAEVLRTLNPRLVSTWATKAPAIRQLTADIRAGKYKSAEELQRALAGMMGQPRN